MDSVLITTEKPDLEENPENLGWKKTILWRGMNFIMAMFFVMAAYVQLNDPDPILWMAWTMAFVIVQVCSFIHHTTRNSSNIHEQFVYAVPATLCLAIVASLTSQEHYIWQAVATANFAADFAGAIYLATRIRPEMEEHSIKNPLVLEEGREMSGLIISMLWMGICKIVSRCQREGKLSLAFWVFVVVLCLIPFSLWAYCYRTLDPNALPGHCKDML